MKRPRARPFILASLLIAAAAAFLLYNKPWIEMLEPSGLDPGGILSVKGRSFGSRRGSGAVLVDSVPLTASSYVSWEDGEIRVRVPESMDSGIVTVRTIFGTSNPDIAIRKNLLPVPPPPGGQNVAGPVILSISPQEAKTGYLVTIEGLNFGTDLQSSVVRFSSDAAQTARFLEEGRAGSLTPRGLLPYVEPAASTGLYESWDDKHIVVRIPEGTGSGPVIVRTPLGDSNAVQLKMAKASGSKTLADQAVYSIRQRVTVKPPARAGAGSLLLYLPRPLEGYGQFAAAAPESVPPAEIDAYGGVAAYRIGDLSGLSGKELTIERTSLVSVYAVETELSSCKDDFPGGKIPPFLSAFVSADAFVPSDDADIVALARKLAAKAGYPQKKAELARDWLVSNMRWKPGSDGKNADPASALRAKLATSREYSLLAAAMLRAAQVPAVPVSGFLLRKNGTAIPHWWLEYYLPAVGWIPWDPVLALGARPGGFDAGLAETERYFGCLDNRRVAMSRGVQEVSSLAGLPRKERRKVDWSMQTLFEEADSADYQTVWHDPELLGSY